MDTDRYLDLKRRVLGLLDAGKFHEAYSCCLALSQESEHDAEVWLLLATVNGHLGRFQATIDCSRRAIQIQPDYIDAHLTMGNALWALASRADALASYRTAAQLSPSRADPHLAMGMAYYELAQYHESLDCLRTAAEVAPDSAVVSDSLGMTLLQLGRTDEAIAQFRCAIQLQPNAAPVHFRLANALCRMKRIKEALSGYRTAIRLDPRYAEARLAFAYALGLAGDLDAAATEYRAALRIQPRNARAYNNLGSVLALLGNGNEASTCFVEAIRLMPSHAGAHNNLGNAHLNAGRLEEAGKCFLAALKLDPKYADACNNLANSLLLQGLSDRAIRSYRRALRLNPDFHKAHSNLLMAINYVSTDRTEIYKEHLQWSRSHGSRHIHRTFFSTDCDPDRPLRVGYVSSDFRAHSVAAFFEPLLAEHDPTQIIAICYSGVTTPDAVTERLRELAVDWIPTYGIDDEQLKRRIRADGIDILVDLQGHTAGNRLRLFSHRCAPIQMTYLGYPNTTGLRTIDYRLTDAEADPPGASEAWNTESLLRLPGCFLCYRPPPVAVPVGPLPADRRNCITFASFNALPKLSPEVIAAWANLLHSVPDSRLLLKNQSLRDPATRDRCAGSFADHDIDPHRLELLGWLPDQEAHLALYRRVDIALDTFPYNGTTTTCEALWMGAPVVTISGTTHASRVGSTLIRCVGLHEFVAPNVDAYVRCAVELARDRERLRRLRTGLRPRILASPLCDAPGFTRGIEHAYRTAWITWCQTMQTDDPNAQP